MSEPVEVLHPVPFRYVPAGGRFERLGFVRMRTPVRVAEADGSAFAPLGTMRAHAPSPYLFGEHAGPRALHVRDGAVWFDLHNADGSAIGRGDLARFLSSEADVDRRDMGDLARHFTNSPAVTRVWPTPYRSQAFRGEAERPAMRHVAWDGTDRARAALVRFLSEDVVLVEGRARARLLAPTLTVSHGPGGGREARAVLDLFPRTGRTVGVRGRVDDPEALLADVGSGDGWTVARPGPEGVTRYLGIDGSPIPADSARGGLARLFANGCHAGALGLTVVMEAIRKAEAGDGMPDHAREALERARTWEARSAIFDVRPDEVEACLADFEAFVSTLRATFRRPGNSPSLAALRRHLVEVALPDLRWDACELDEMELGGLAPGA